MNRSNPRRHTNSSPSNASSGPSRKLTGGSSRLGRALSEDEALSDSTRKSYDDLEEEDDGESSDEEEEEDETDGQDEEDSDVDRPRIAQWEPEVEDPITIDSESRVRDTKINRISSLKDDLSSMSFGTLVRARKALDRAVTEPASEESDSDNEADERPSFVADSEAKMQRESAPSSKPEKRSSKHSPMEMSSKRPVTRRRQVVEVKKAVSRDPRFTPLSGELSPSVFQKRYAFLVDLHKSELSVLKENLKRAKKLLRSSPRDQREEREEEVQRLERALKRAESSVNRDRREQVEREALEKATIEEKARRKQGKGEWHMKDSAKKELLLRARHDALAETGGRFAVKKAIEKRQKKVSQKEKKARPAFASRPGRESGPPSKRHQVEDGQHSRKRRRVN